MASTKHPASKVRRAVSLTDTLVMIAERKNVGRLREQLAALKSAAMIIKRSNRWQITQAGIDCLKGCGVDTSWIFPSKPAVKTIRLSVSETELADLIEATGIACEYLPADSQQQFRFRSILGKLKRAK